MDSFHHIARNFHRPITRLSLDRMEVIDIRMNGIDQRIVDDWDVKHVHDGCELCGHSGGDAVFGHVRRPTFQKRWVMPITARICFVPCSLTVTPGQLVVALPLFLMYPARA